MPIVDCKVCSKKFYAKPFILKKGFGKFCSAACQHIGKRNGKIVECSICKKKVYKPLRALLRSKSKKYFCGKSCQTIWRNTIAFIGPKHANWKGGESAYRDILIRSKIPQTCKKCETKDKRILAAHHVDKNKKNNSIENLIWLCHNCHYLIHHYNVDVSQK